MVEIIFHVWFLFHLCIFLCCILLCYKSKLICYSGALNSCLFTEYGPLEGGGENYQMGP